MACYRQRNPSQYIVVAAFVQRMLTRVVSFQNFDNLGIFIYWPSLSIGFGSFSFCLIQICVWFKILQLLCLFRKKINCSFDGTNGRRQNIRFSAANKPCAVWFICCCYRNRTLHFNICFFMHRRFRNVQEFQADSGRSTVAPRTYAHTRALIRKRIERTKEKEINVKIYEPKAKFL